MDALLQWQIRPPARPRTLQTMVAAGCRCANWHATRAPSTTVHTHAHAHTYTHKTIIISLRHHTHTHTATPSKYKKVYFKSEKKLIDGAFHSVESADDKKMLHNARKPLAFGIQRRSSRGKFACLFARLLLPLLILSEVSDVCSTHASSSACDITPQPLIMFTKLCVSSS